MDVNLGDATLRINLVIPGLRRYGFSIHVGVPRDTEPADRAIKPPPYYSPPAVGRLDFLMDLQADKKVTLSGKWTDEVGNAVDSPDGATVTYTVDDQTIINLTDNGDGTAVAAATGTLGNAVVHGEASPGGSADFLIAVVAGDAERFEIEAGEPEEVTPDDLEPTPEP